MRLAAIVLFSLACALDGRARNPRAEPPRPQFAGCGAVLEQGVCELPKDLAIRIFAPPRAHFAADGKPLAATPLRALPHGTLHRVVVPEHARKLTVDGFALKLAPPTTYAWLVEARAIRAKDREAARTLAERALSSHDPAERALALGLIARVELSKGLIEPAIAHFREALALPSARVSDRAEDAFALAFALNQRSRRYGEARAALDAIEPSLADYPEGRARIPFYRAEIALESGDTRAALRGLGRASAMAGELGLTRLERNALGLRAAVLQIQGHFDEGIAALQALDRELGADTNADACDHVDTLNNLGFALERRQRANEDLGDPHPEQDLEPTAKRALSLKCADPHRRGLALYIAAAAALQRKAYGEAKRLLTEARPAVLRTNDVLQWLDLEARIALEEGRTKEAIAKYEEAVRVAEAAHQTDMVWRATVGLAESLEAAGDDRAIDAYRRAEVVLDDQTLALPLGEGRGVYLSRSERSARLAIDLLLRSRKTFEAFAVARRARARLLVATARATSLDALDPESRKRWDAAVATFRAARGELDAASEGDWKLAASDLQAARTTRAAQITAMTAALDDAMASLALPRSQAPLAEPAAGELWIGFHRAHHGYVAFAATADRITSFPLQLSTDLAVLGPRILSELDLKGIERIVLLPYGPLRALDLHTVLPLPVEYALDVPRTRAPADGGMAIVVDPTNDLAATREEARAIQSLFHNATTTEGTAATAHAVAQVLETSGTFHYAGHGIFAGPEGMEARLPLAGGSALGILDVLTRARVPRRVLLSACETGRAPDARTETIGLAHAFVLAGSETVIAPTRAVPDALAAKVAIAYYRAVLAGHLPAEALHRARLEITAIDPTADTAAWRVLRH